MTDKPIGIREKTYVPHDVAVRDLAAEVESLRQQLAAAEERWQNVRERYSDLMKRYDSLLDAAVAAEARAEAAEADAAQLRDALVKQYGTLDRVDTVLDEVVALRRVAEAVRKSGSIAPAHLRAWADQYDAQLGYEGAIMSVWLREVADALAALDAAQEQKRGGKGSERQE